MEQHIKAQEPRSGFNPATPLLSFRDTRHPVNHTRIREFRLRLRDPRDFFVAPEFDPFAEDQLPISGIDYLFSALKPSRIAEKIHIVIQLPPEKVTEGLTEQMKAALMHFCQYRIDAGERELDTQRWRAFKALQTGILFLGLCLLLSTLADGAGFLPEWLRRLSSETLIIIGSVGLWHPAESFLFDWRPTRRDMQVCKRLIDMEMVIEPIPPA